MDLGDGYSSPLAKVNAEISDTQLKILKSHFGFNPHPSEEDVRCIAVPTRLRKEVVSQWFKNSHQNLNNYPEYGSKSDCSDSPKIAKSECILDVKPVLPIGVKRRKRSVANSELHETSNDASKNVQIFNRQKRCPKIITQIETFDEKKCHEESETVDADDVLTNQDVPESGKCVNNSVKRTQTGNVDFGVESNITASGSNIYKTEDEFFKAKSGCYSSVSDESATTIDDKCNGDKAVSLSNGTKNAERVCDSYPSKTKHYRKKRGERKLERTFFCGVCNEKFFSSIILSRHLKNHAHGNMFKCDLCKKTFPDHNILKKHKLYHPKVKRFVCDICNMGFACPSNLRAHVKVHEGIKPYACSECNKTFATSHNLIVHKRTHTGEKPFSCKLCNQSFSQWASVKRHMVRHSGKRQSQRT